MAGKIFSPAAMRMDLPDDTSTLRHRSVREAALPFPGDRFSKSPKHAIRARI